MKKSLILILALGMFTMGCNTFMFPGLLPQISLTIGQPISITGQGITVFSLAYFISAPLFSMMFSNKPVKQTINIALALFLLGNLITLASKSLIPFLFGRSLVGVGTGIFTPLCVTIAINSCDSSVRGRVLSLVWGANSAGVVFGVPFGLFLSSLVNWQLSLGYLIILSSLTLFGFSLQNTNITLPVLPSFRERCRLLLDQRVMVVIGITLFIAMASLGLYSYVAPIQSGSPNSLASVVFIMGLGGLFGSSFVGICIDLTQKPRIIMALIIAGLLLTFLSMPFTKNLPYIGLIPFFMWGVFAWAASTPQQHILFELQEKQGAILAALNVSATALGGALGTAIGGSIIALGFEEIHLPFFASILLLVALIGQMFFSLPRKSYKRSLVRE